MTAKRTDKHCPSRIQPEDYQYVAMEYMKTDSLQDALFLTREREILRSHMERTRGSWSQHQHGGNCMICGAYCIYMAVFYHPESNSYIRTGMICAEKMHMGVPYIFRTFRKNVKEARARIAGKAKAEVLLKDAGLEQAWTIFNQELSEFDVQVQNSALTIRDIVHTVIRYGNLSEKQSNFIRTLIDRIQRWPEIQAQREREKEAAEDCPKGKVEITGEIVSIKVKEGWGGYDRIVMTVKDDRGFLVWGTLPNNIPSDSKGNRIKFSANVEPSDNDPKFGFFKRPTKAEKIDEKDDTTTTNL